MTNRLSMLSALAAVTVLAFPGIAFAHITLETQTVAPGATYKAVLRVPHGCEGRTTTGIKVKIPEGFFGVKPMPKPGWSITTTKAKYAKSYEQFGSQVTEGVVEIDWTGGSLPDDFYDEFTFRGTFAKDLPVGSAFYFPTVQVCGDTETGWIDTSGTEGETPAPSVKFVQAP